MFFFRHSGPTEAWGGARKWAAHVFGERLVWWYLYRSFGPLVKAIECCKVKVSEAICLTWEVVISVRIEWSAEAVTQRRQFHQ